VLVLSDVATANVAQRRVWIDDAQLAQVLQAHQVLGLSGSIEPLAAECQCAVGLVDMVEQRSRSWKSAPSPSAHCNKSGTARTRAITRSFIPNSSMSTIEALHVVAALHIFVHLAPAGAAKGLDRKELHAIQHDQPRATWQTLRTRAASSEQRTSPSSMRVASPPRTIGTLFPAWIWYGATEWPLRFEMLLTG